MHRGALLNRPSASTRKTQDKMRRSCAKWLPRAVPLLPHERSVCALVFERCEKLPRLYHCAAVLSVLCVEFLDRSAQRLFPLYISKTSISFLLVHSILSWRLKVIAIDEKRQVTTVMKSLHLHRREPPPSFSAKRGWRKSNSTPYTLRRQRQTCARVDKQHAAEIVVEKTSNTCNARQFLIGGEHREAFPPRRCKRNVTCCMALLPTLHDKT